MTSELGEVSGPVSVDHELHDQMVGSFLDQSVSIHVGEAPQDDALQSERGPDAAARQTDRGVCPSRRRHDARERYAAPTGVLQEPRHVAQSVPYERHRERAQAGHDHLTLLARGHRHTVAIQDLQAHVVHGHVQAQAGPTFPRSGRCLRTSQTALGWTKRPSGRQTMSSTRPWSSESSDRFRPHGHRGVPHASSHPYPRCTWNTAGVWPHERHNPTRERAGPVLRGARMVPSCARWRAWRPEHRREAGQAGKP
jgi:hypothetical protein